MLKEREIVRNYSFLTLIQTVNILVPLITTPYIIRIIGAENFGKTVVCQAFLIFPITLCEFGFNVTGSRDIALQKEDLPTLSRTFSEIIGTKILLMLLSLALFIAALCFIPTFKSESVLYVLSLTLLISGTFDPLWFFIGAEEMKFMAYVNFLNKGVYFIAIFTLIQLPSDYIWLNFILGFSGIISLVVGYIYLFRRFKLTFIQPYLASVLRRIGQNLPIFASTLAVQSCLSASILILRFFQSDYIVGIFGVVQRIITLARTLLTSLAMAAYAKVCTAINKGDKPALISLFRHAYLPFVGLLVMGLGIGYCLSPFVIQFFLGKIDVNAVNLLRGYLLIPLVVVLNIPATLFIQALDKRRLYFVIVSITAFFSLCLTWFLTRQFDMWGTMWATILSEMILVIGVCIGAWHIRNSFIKTSH
ncbi:MAG: oligosaccharide flippase family protein [Saprospiraceae bacterium]|nr:oligosaccharide flippase family protein [Saprospiraceae bacterium]